MSDFFSPPPGFGLPPDEPDIPAPDFQNAGMSFALGVGKSGVSGSWWNGLWDGFINAVVKLLAMLLSLLITIFAKIISIVGDVTSDASSSYGTLVAATLKELFGIDVDPASVGTRRAGPDRQLVANKLGQTIISTFFSTAQALPGGGIAPSQAAADNFLAVTMNMELNGWIESWVTDGLSAHILEKYGDLKDGIARVLGLGRMSRQVFAPPLKVLVHDPYLALLEQKYRPKQMEPTVAIRQFFNGDVTRESLSKTLGDQGYSEIYIDLLIQQQRKFLPLADIDYLNARGMWTDDQVIEQLGSEGFDTATAGHVLEVLKDKRIQKYRQQMLDAAEQAFVAGNITVDAFSQVVQSYGVTDEEQTWITTVSTFKRSLKVRHLSEGEIIKGIEEGLLNFNDLRDWSVREGMPLAEEQILELETQFAENKQSALAKAKAATATAKAQAATAKAQLAQQKAVAAQTQAADKGVTVAQAESLVKDGIWTFDQFRAYLTSQGYGPDAIDGLVALLHKSIDATAASAATAAAVRATAAAKGLSLAEMEKAVVEGILTTDQLGAYLTGHGFDADDAATVVKLTQNAADAAKVKAAAKTAATAKAATKSISLAELERAVRLGLTTMDNYNAALKGAGFDQMSITLLDGILQSQIADDKAAAAKSAAASSASTAKGITLAQLAQEVVSGIRPIGDYTTELSVLKYNAQDQQQLTALLQLKVDQAKATAAKRAAAAAQLAARGISLTDAERAVKLGIVPIATYQQMLRAANFTPDAIDVLSNTLIAEMAATKKAQTAANSATTTLAAKQISLPDVERAVIAGLQPISTYTTMLTTNGYSDADAGTLTSLLQLKVDQAARAAAAHADAEGLATQKGISLANEEAAVVDGNKSMSDYDALLTVLGYDDIDRATLEALLQKKVDAAAAKAAAAGDGGAADDSGTASTPDATQ